MVDALILLVGRGVNISLPAELLDCARHRTLIKAAETREVEQADAVLLENTQQEELLPAADIIPLQRQVEIPLGVALQQGYVPQHSDWLMLHHVHSSNS